MLYLRRLSFFGILLVVLIGCGQQGPLYLPPPKASHAIHQNA